MTENAPTMYHRGEKIVWAMRITGDPSLNRRVQHWGELHTKTGEVVPIELQSTGRGVIVHTPEGTREAAVGDYVIHDPDGGFRPCPAEAFPLTYAETPRQNNRSNRKDSSHE